MWRNDSNTSYDLKVIITNVQIIKLPTCAIFLMWSSTIFSNYKVGKEVADDTGCQSSTIITSNFVLFGKFSIGARSQRLL